MRKEREFVYVGEAISNIDTAIHADFLLQVQKSMLASLVQRNLLSAYQAECVMDRLKG